MSLSLWPYKCFGAGKGPCTEAASQGAGEGRAITFVLQSCWLCGLNPLLFLLHSPPVFGSSSAKLLDTSSAETSLAPGTSLQHSFQPSFLFINSEMTDRGWSLI